MPKQPRRVEGAGKLRDTRRPTLAAKPGPDTIGAAAGIVERRFGKKWEARACQASTPTRRPCAGWSRRSGTAGTSTPCPRCTRRTRRSASATRPWSASRRSATATFQAAFPDLRHEIADLLVDGDRVALRFRGRGTQEGEYLGIAPSGKVLDFEAIAIFRMEAGRIAEVWAHSNRAQKLAEF
jgi:predicted ester cyclase